MTRPPADRWTALLDRWDRFQATYVPLREEQFSTMLDYVAVPAGSEPALLDLCSGPGSLAHRALARWPRARIVAVDADRRMLALGKSAESGHRIRWVKADVRTDRWSSELNRAPFDTVLLATALEWFTDRELEALYRRIHGVLRPGGIFLAGGILPRNSGEVAMRSRAFLDRRTQRIVTAGEGEHWSTFWRAVDTDAAFQKMQDRDGKMGMRGGRVVPLIAFHEQALHRAGFAEVGEVWRVHASGVLAAIR